MGCSFIRCLSYQWQLCHISLRKSLRQHRGLRHLKVSQLIVDKVGRNQSVQADEGALSGWEAGEGVVCSQMWRPVSLISQRGLQEKGPIHAQLFPSFWIETAVKDVSFLAGEDSSLFLLMHCRIVLGILFKIRVVYDEILTCFLIMKK